MDELTVHLLVNVSLHKNEDGNLRTYLKKNRNGKYNENGAKSCMNHKCFDNGVFTFREKTKY
jgi:hypothetical protein